MKYLVVLLLVIVSAASHGKSKPEEIDRRLVALNGVLRSGHSAEFIRKNKEILRDSRQIPYSKGVAQACLRIAVAVIGQGDLQQGDEYLEFAKKESYAKSSVLFQGQINNVYATMAMSQKLFDKALERLRLSEDTVSDFYVTRLVMMAGCFSGLKQSDSAFVYLRKSFPLIKTAGKRIARMLLPNAYCIMGLELSRQHRPDSAMYYMAMGQKVAEETKDIKSLSIVKTFLGQLYLQRDHADLAIINFEEGLKLIRYSKDVYAINELYFSLYQAYYLKGAHTQANYYLNLYQSLSNSIKQGNNLSVVVNTIKRDEDGNFIRVRSRLIALIIIIGVSIVVLSLLAYQKFKRHKLVVGNIIKEKDELLYAVTAPKSQIEIESIGLLSDLAKSRDPLFFEHFNKLYSDFDATLLQIYPNLNTSDVEFCKYLRMNFDTKKIARLTERSVRSVESKKHRLRKKLKILPTEDIYLLIARI